MQVEVRPKALGFIPQVPEVQGWYRGKRVRFYTYTTGSGKSRTHWAAVSATPPEPSPLTLRISRQGVGSKVRALFGAKEIELGDAAFDRRWFIETDAPDFLRAAILPEVRTRLDRIAQRSRAGTYETVAGAVRYAEVGGFDSIERGERYIEALEAVCDLADVAEVYRGALEVTVLTPAAALMRPHGEAAARSRSV